MCTSYAIAQASISSMMLRALTACTHQALPCLGIAVHETGWLVRAVSDLQAATRDQGGSAPSQSSVASCGLLAAQEIQGKLHPISLTTLQQPPQSMVHLRGLKVLRRRFDLPPDIEGIVKQELEAIQQKPAPPEVPPVAARPLERDSRRVGCIAYKAGMTQDWDEHGVRVPLTVLWIDDCQVVGYKWPELHGYRALVVGAGYRQQKNLHPGQAGLYLKLGLPFKSMMREFKVSEDGMLPVGTPITAAHFTAGQHVDLTGWTKNKGFQGVMKRWGFSGLPASHGVSLAHRSPGSIGNRTSPGKVWKGKKMPGQMGDEQCTVRNCLVYKVDAARNLLFIRGVVPGPAGQEVVIRDAKVKHEVRLGWSLPHPTYTGSDSAVFADLGRVGAALAVSIARGEAPLAAAPTLLPPPDKVPDITVFQANKDPYIPYAQETDYFEVKWKKGD